MLARVRTVTFQGIETLDIDVQVQMMGGTNSIINVSKPLESDFFNPNLTKSTRLVIIMFRIRLQ